MVWVIAFGELFFGGLWRVVWGYGGMRTHFSLLNPHLATYQGQQSCKNPPAFRPGDFVPFVELRGIEPLTSCLQSRCSTN